MGYAYYYNENNRHTPKKDNNTKEPSRSFSHATVAKKAVLVVP